MSAPVDPKTVNAILGEALTLLAKDGVPAEQVGSFALAYPERVFAVLGRPQPPVEHVPDLVKLIRDAMASFVADGGLISGVADRGSPDRRLVRVNVLVNGQRTTVSITKALLDKVATETGSDRAARSLVRELAAQAPTDVKSRSVWLDRQLQAHLVMSKMSPSATPPH
jgi:hypothetical protein